MTDIFISYSRRDKAFVRTLYEALNQLNRDAWLTGEILHQPSNGRKPFSNNPKTSRGCTQEQSINLLNLENKGFRQ
jgi:hypothetical protein